jgi:hypothetical protein
MRLPTTPGDDTIQFMDPVKLFRALIIGEVALSVVSLLPMFLAPDYPEAVQQYLDASQPSFMNIDEGLTPAWIVTTGLAFLLLAAWVVALIGLWTFRRWARPLYVAVTVMTLILMVPFGSSITSGIEDMIGSLGMMVSGAIVAALFFAPLRERFDTGH